MDWGSGNNCRGSRSNQRPDPDCPTWWREVLCWPRATNGFKTGASESQTPQENSALFLYNKILIAQAVYICSPYLALSVNKPLQEHTIFFNNFTD